MPAYTPGPWSTFKNIPSVYAENGREIVYHAHMTRSAPEEERMANARLIAAAPELLEALKTLAPFMDIAFGAEGDTFGVHHNDANDALIAAEAAIAKAEAQ